MYNLEPLKYRIKIIPEVRCLKSHKIMNEIKIKRWGFWPYEKWYLRLDIWSHSYWLTEYLLMYGTNIIVMFRKNPYSTLRYPWIKKINTPTNYALEGIIDNRYKIENRYIQNFKPFLSLHVTYLVSKILLLLITTFILAIIVIVYIYFENRGEMEVYLQVHEKNGGLTKKNV